MPPSFDHLLGIRLQLLGLDSIDQEVAETVGGTVSQQWKGYQ
jgi:hypothetical protein